MRCSNRTGRAPGKTVVFAACRLALALLAGVWIICAHAADKPDKPVFHPGIDTACSAASADQSLVMLVFSATWCEPCQELRKTCLESSNFLDHAGLVHIVDIDVDEDPKTSAAYEVKAMPTLILMSADKKIVARETGLLEPAAFLDWIEQARRRASQGKWEGTAPAGRLDEFIGKSNAGSLSHDDLAKLVGILDDPDPAERAAASEIILAQRDDAVPLLIDAATNAYLGTRIAASELLAKLDTQAPRFDPWLSPADLSGASQALRKWWSDTGHLPVSPESKPDPALRSSIEDALENLRGDDAVKRTEAMSALVLHGEDALPAVRAAIQRAEHAGNHPLVALLDDVRWGILVPDSLEKDTGGVRRALARGDSPEQQAAAGRLGHAGKPALPALIELSSSADPLVVESAVRALSTMGGPEVVAAMAALLKSTDGNLRMTAAQLLGHTKDASANKSVLSVTDDPNEVVACAAISALEEINSGPEYSPSPPSIPSEVTAGLRKAMTDTRWRVRATAAEVSGKMQIHDAVDDLKKLLDDPDAFVVKTSLTALQTLSAQPDATRLLAVTRRLPGLRQDVVAVLMQSPSAQSAEVVTNLFASGSVDQQVQMMNALVRERGGEQMTGAVDVWGPLVTNAAVSAEPRLRRATANVLGAVATPSQAGLITLLLSDDDAQTRAGAAKAVLHILAEEMQKKMEEQERQSSSGRKTTSTNNSGISAEQLAAWHQAMSQRPDASTDPSLAVALYLVGDGKTDLPLLTKAFAKPEAFGINNHSLLTESPELVFGKLPWPESKPVLDSICASPALFVRAVASTPMMNSNAAAYLLEPARFRAAVERASGADLTLAIGTLAGPEYYGRSRWSLISDSPEARGVVEALVESTNAAWRALAVYALGRSDPTNHVSDFEKALKDTDPWLRANAAQALARAVTDPTNLAALVAPLLEDRDYNVVRAAAISLLDPDVRTAAGYDEEFKAFRYQGASVDREFSMNQTDSRPLSIIEDKPAFLDGVRKRLPLSAPRTKPVLALLLAQYGDFDALDKMTDAPALPFGLDKEIDLTSTVLTGIALSHDKKYVPYLRNLALKSKSQSGLRSVLGAMRGMTGPEARQLRVDVNKLLETATND